MTQDFKDIYKICYKILTNVDVTTLLEQKNSYLCYKNFFEAVVQKEYLSQ